MIRTFFYERLNKDMHHIGVVPVALLLILLSFTITGCGKSESLSRIKEKKVGKAVSEDKFIEFYYTYSTTVNPPEFQRYRFYMEDGKPMFYHEKREGDKVFLTEEDITVHGTMELSEEEYNIFWDYMCSGTVKNRENNINSGGSGPWLYLYWDGDKGKCQQFSFNEYGTVLEFETFCEELKEKQINEWTDSNGTTASGEPEDSSADANVQDVSSGGDDASLSEEVVYPNRKNRVEVSNTLEFLDAIANNTEIVMNGGVYNFTEDIQLEGEEQFINWNTNHENVLLSMNLSDGFATEVYCIEGLSIVAAPGASVSIVTKPRNVNVLLFSSCSDIFISGITMGHTPDKGSCEGGVLKFEYCENIELHYMDLYGCGTYGIVFNDVNSLSLSDSNIRDCSLGILDGSNGKNFEFITCNMVDCKGPIMISTDTTDAVFNHCYFLRNSISRGLLPVDNMENNFVFKECLFGASEAQSISTLDYADNGCIRFENCEYENE